MTSGIYMVVNQVNGKQYIGSARDYAKRRADHRSRLRGDYHANRHLQAAWNKYGEDVFRFRLMLECGLENLVLFEQRAIDLLKPAYNLAPHAGSSLGRICSNETRHKISDAKKGHGFSDEALRKMSDAKKGHRLSDETRHKLSEAHKGVQFSDQHRHNIGKAQAGHKVSEETRRKLRNANVGHYVSGETRRKLSEATKRQWTIKRIAPL